MPSITEPTWYYVRAMIYNGGYVYFDAKRKVWVPDDVTPDCLMSLAEAQCIARDNGLGYSHVYPYNAR